MDAPISCQVRAFLMSLLQEADKSEDGQLKRGILGPLAFSLTLYSFFKNQQLTSLTRFLASSETLGVEGKLRSTFIILQGLKFQSVNWLTKADDNEKVLHILEYLLNVSVWLSASNGGTPYKNS